MQKGAVTRIGAVAPLTIFFLIILTGCATKEALKNVSDEEVLRERVTVYWNHKVNGEFDKSFYYEHPLYQKKTGLVNYIKGFKTGVVKWLGAGIASITMEGESATVDLNLKTRVKIPQAKPFETDSLIKGKWVKVEGVWYHVPAEF